MPHNTHTRNAACKRLAHRELQYAQCGELECWEVQLTDAIIELKPRALECGELERWEVQLTLPKRCARTISKL